MRVICETCGYVSESLPDYRRHLEQYKECNDVSRRRNREKREKQRQQTEKTLTQVETKPRIYVPVKSVKIGQILSDATALKTEGAITYEIPRPVCFTVFPGRAK